MLIEFKSPYGHPVYINPYHVAVVEASGEPKTTHVQVFGQDYVVQGTVHEVTKKLEDAVKSEPTGWSWPRRK